MPPFNFESPGANAYQAITQYMLQRQAENRQALLDKLKMEADRQAADRQQQQLMLQAETERRLGEEHAATQKGLETERRFRRASTIAGDALPGDEYTPEVAALLEEQGYGAQHKKVPGILSQGPLLSVDEQDIPTYQVNQTPDKFVSRGGSKYNAARVAAEEKAELARELAQQRADIAADNRIAADERARADRELRELLGRMQYANSSELQALRADALRISNALGQANLDTKTKEREGKARDVASSRATVRDLAQGLLDDPALDSITGAIEGRRDTFLTGRAADALSRYNQLVKSLSFAERSKLQGQGAVSDYEGRGLEQSVTSLNRAAGPQITRQHLREIVNYFQGDVPTGQSRVGGGGGGGGGRGGAGIRYDENGNPL